MSHLSTTQQHVYSAIVDKPGRTVRQIHEEEGIPLGTISNCLVALREKGLVKPNPERGSSGYGLLFPVESECPATTAPEESAATVIFDGRVDSLISDGGEKLSGDDGEDVSPSEPPAPHPLGAVPASEPMPPPECWVCHERTATQVNAGGFLAFCEVCDPPASGPGHHPVVQPAPADMLLVSRGEHIASLGAAKELAGENAALKAQIKEIRDLLGCDGMPEDALCHLSEVLADAKVHLPKCDRSPNCKSLHLSTRIHELADERDMYRHSHNAAAQQHSRLCKAFGRAMDPEELEAAILAAVGIQRKLESDLGATRRFLESEHRRANDAEDQLSEIDWLCDAAGFTGSGDTSDRFMWLLGHLGFDWMAAAIRQRRQIAGQIRDLEVSLQELAKRVRLGLPPETDDRCKCGNEARKVEGEDGFTKCDDCYQDGEE